MDLELGTLPIITLVNIRKQYISMSNLTLEDIAKLAGVSRSTASRVVNQQPNVREEVRQRVEQVILQTGYRPNVAARTLVSQRSWMIGLVLPRGVSSFFSDPYFPRLTQGIAQACNQHDYTLSLFLVSTPEDEEKIFTRVSRRGMLDGILVQSGQIGDRLIDRLTRAKIPLVIAGRPGGDYEVSYIDVDNIRAAEQAVSHLFHLGYRRVALITGAQNSPVSIDRRLGYEQAHRKRDQQVDDSLIAQGDFSEASGYYAMQRILPRQPDAVFSASDQMAVGAMRAIQEAGLNIPNDIAIIGFDDLPFAQNTQPPLTTVRQPIYQFGFTAVELLIDLINNGIRPARRILMNTDLIIRQSCGAFANSSKKSLHS